MKIIKTTFLDYYVKNKIIPTVDLRDSSLKKIFKQRINFYNSIHIDINLFKQKRILELCPGTGYNAYFLLKNGIKKIKLIDFNPYSIKQIKTNLAKYKKRINLIEGDIYKIKLKEKYDLIIIENALSTLDDPEKILKKYFSLLKKNGFFLTNYWDSYTLLNEKLRGLISHLILSNHKEKNFQEQVSIISKFFLSHYEKLILKNSSKKKINNLRKIEKWCQDTPMNYDLLNLKNYFTFDKFLKLAYKNKISLWKTSPDFNLDFTWYKNFDKKKFLQNNIKNYHENRINFIHHQEKFYQKIPKNSQRKIFKGIKNIDKVMFKLKKNKKIQAVEIKIIIANLSLLISCFNLIKKDNLISKSLNELKFFLVFYLDNPSKIEKYKKFKFFKNFWGNTVINSSFQKS